MEDNTTETTASLFSHEESDGNEGGRINVNPSDPETTLKKFNVARSGYRDQEPDVPKSVRTRSTISKVTAKKDGKREVIVAAVHQPNFDTSSCNDNIEEPDLCDSDSSDGQTLWHLSKNAPKGMTHHR